MADAAISKRDDGDINTAFDCAPLPTNAPRASRDTKKTRDVRGTTGSMDIKICRRLATTRPGNGGRVHAQFREGSYA